MIRKSHAAALAALIAVTGSVSPSMANDAVRVRLDWSWWAGQVPMLLAENKGFYEALELDVDIVQGQGSRTTTIVVGENADPIGHVNLSTAAQSIAAGVPITAVAGWWQQGPISLICTDTAIKSPADVKGKRIGSTPTGSDGQILPAFLAANGLTTDDVSIVNMPGDAKFAAIVAGQIDCLSGDDYFYAPQLQAQGKELSILKYADWGVTNLAFGVVVNDTYLAENPEIVRKFLAGTRHGLEYAFANKEEAVDLFIEVSGNTQPREFHLSVLEAYENSLHTQATADKPAGWMDTADWAAMNDTLVKHGGMPEGKQAPEFFSNDYLPE